MSLVRAELSTSLNLGGAHKTVSYFAPGAFVGVPYRETPEGGLQIYKSDGSRLTYPVTSIRNRCRDGSPEELLPIPRVDRWRIESIYLKSSVFLDHLGEQLMWTRAKFGALTDAEIQARQIIITKPAPRLGVIEIPLASVLWYLESPAVEPSQEPPPSEDTAEHMPVRPAPRAQKAR